MSSITKRPNGKWRARYRDEDNHEHSRHFDRKVDGQRWLDEVTASVVTGQYVDPRAGKITVRQYAAQWEAAQIGRASTARVVDNALRLHLLPALGDRRIDAVRRSDIQGFVKHLIRDGLAPGTIANIYDVTARLFGAAVDDKVIAETPARRITLPTAERSNVVPPAIELVDRLAGALPDRYRAAVVLLAGSGLRIGELLGLRVSDVDFLRRELRVERQRLQSGELGPPKSDESYRTVPLGQVVIDELAAHLAVGHNDGSEWLFTSSRGFLTYAAWDSAIEIAERPPRKDTLKKSCERCHAGAEAPCVNKAGRATSFPHSVRETAARGRVRLDAHDLRHFYASQMLSGGASVNQVSEWLGHASPVVTLKVYAHLMPGDDDRARSVMDAALSVLRTGRGLAISG